MGLVISTHSLTRRLTEIIPQKIWNTEDFNSQPHKEADHEKLLHLQQYRKFQLTASQGG